MQCIGMGLIGLSFRTSKPAEQLADLINKNTRQKRVRKRRKGFRRYFRCLRVFGSTKSNLGTHERRALNATKSTLCCRRTADNAFFHDKYNVLDFVLLLSAFAACMEYLIYAINVTQTQAEQRAVGSDAKIIFRIVTAVAVFRAVRPMRLLTSVPQVQNCLDALPCTRVGDEPLVSCYACDLIDVTACVC